MLQEALSVHFNGLDELDGLDGLDARKVEVRRKKATSGFLQNFRLDPENRASSASSPSSRSFF